MIISVEDLKRFPEFTGQDNYVLSQKLNAIEETIRKMTNNNFQNRIIRFTASSNGTTLNGSSTFIKVGDTVQVSESGVNDGLYVVEEVATDHITVDRSMFSVDHNLVTKVEYPQDIVIGVVGLMRYDVMRGDKIGIQSETISRHTITYMGDQQTERKMGYPVTLFDFLKPYRKARF